MKHFLHTITFSIIISTSIHAQVFQWTFSNPGQSGNGITTDNNGNIYLIASGIGGSYGPFTFTSSSQTVAKHDTAGNVVWVSWIKAANCSNISIDRFDNIYVVGSCGNATFASVSNTIQVTQLGNWDSFLAKYDSNGNILWVRTSGTSQSTDAFNVSNVQVRVINNLGETLYREEQKHKGGQYSKVFDLSSLPKGIYFVEIKTNEDRYIKKVVLE